jgi:uncharacterized protein YegP (UPF0339 family)
MYRFRIKGAAGGQYRVQFTYNSEVMVWSENYASKAGARNCIASIKKNAGSASIVDLTEGETGKGYRFEIDKSSNGEFFVRFKASNGETMVRSETYTSRQNAKKCAESVRKKAEGAEVVDESKAS